MTQAQILVVDDEPDIRELVREILEDEGYEVTVAENGEAARTAYARKTPNLVLLDIWMPDVDGITLLGEWSAGGGLECPVVVMSGHGSVETAIEATRLGAYDFVQKPISLARLLSIVSQALESGRTTQKPPTTPKSSASEPIGNSALMQVLRGKAEQAAQHDLPVLIMGEKGSGRENLARYIHGQSKSGGEFITVDHCDLVEGNNRSYLLGSEDPENGEAGCFNLARGGTLFIPDLEEVPPDTLTMPDQANGNETLQQLYYRLNVLPLKMPPLRERPDDVPELVRFYADWFPNHESLPYRAFSVAAQNRLRNHSWPGNIRELRNLIQRLLVLGGEGEVSVAEIEEALKQNPVKAPDDKQGYPQFFDLPLREAREQFERAYLIYKLKEAGGSVGKLAEMVGMERTHLYRKLRALGVDPKTVSAEGGGR
jgi:DNA-binding NtrC family response regulator